MTTQQKPGDVVAVIAPSGRELTEPRAVRSAWLAVTRLFGQDAQTFRLANGQLVRVRRR